MKRGTLALMARNKQRQRPDAGEKTARSWSLEFSRCVASDRRGARNGGAASGRDAVIRWRHVRARGPSAADATAPVQTVRCACRLSSRSVGSSFFATAGPASDLPFVGLLNVHSWSDFHGR